MTKLIKYEQARHALAVCKQVDEVKDWADKAAAMQAYGRMAKDKALEVDAAEIRIRAERRLGELIAAQKAGPGLNTGSKGIGKSAVATNDRTPTLADVGISKDLSSRAQNIAAVPEQEFEQEIGEWRERVTAEGARVSARLEAKGAQVRQGPVPEPDDMPSDDEIMADLEETIRKRDALIAALEAEDGKEELAKQVRLVQHYQREIGMEQDKNARLLKERDEAWKWRNRVCEAVGEAHPTKALAAIRAAFAKEAA